MKWVSMAAYKSERTMRNAKRWLEWCKAFLHWTLEQWKHVLWSNDSLFIWKSDGRMGLADARRMGLFFMVGLGPLVPVLTATAFTDILDNSVL
jgi:hypothetical protein